MEKASGVEQEGYSVTIPYFKTGNAQKDNADAVPDMVMLGRLNTQYIISTYPINSTRLSLVLSAELTYIYQNLDYYPHAWVEDGGTVYLDHVSKLHITPNQISLSATGPGKLVLSEITYPGWKVWVNGQSQPINTAYDILRSVDLSNGQNEILMRFQPSSLLIGGIITIVTILAILVLEIIKTFEREPHHV